MNILSRVTGGQQSIIDGRLQSTIPGANLYLLNPSGVLFGPNASLDLSGSFHVSTADVLRFTDGATFSAHIGERSTLTTAPPAAFGFLGPTPASITVQGSSLGVSEGKAVSVVGGEIQIVGGQLVAPSGRVQIASVASPGEVLASPLEMEPDLQVNAFAHLGQLTLSQNALLNASGNGGGTVLIRSGRLLVDQSSILADTLGNTNGARKGIDIAVTEDIRHTRGGFITAGSFGAGDAGNVQITARSLHVDGAGALSVIGAGTFMGGGRAGNLRIDVGTLTLMNGAMIDSSAFASGRGGTVTVTATDAITLAGTNLDGTRLSGIFAGAAGTDAGAGNAGSLVVQAPRITLTGGAQISSSTSGPGQGGTATVTATDAITLAGTNLDGTRLSGIFATTGGTNAGAGNAGSLVVQAPRVTLTGGAQISSTTFGPGQGGTATVTATDVLSIAGTNLDSTRPSGIFAGAQGTNPGAGNAGSLVVQAARVALTEGARISSSTSGPGQGGTVTVTAMDSITLAGQDSFGNASGLFANSLGNGDAGHVAVATPTLTMDGGNIQAVSFNSGNAGNITLEVGRLTLTGGAQIGSNSLDTGHGGTITVTATDAVSLAENARIDASGAGGGTVVIRSGRLLVDQATIAANTLGAAHSAGLGIDLDVRDSIVLTQDAVIAAVSFGAGDAGAIRIAAHSLRGTDNAFIGTVAMADGKAGDIRIDVGTLTLANRAVIDGNTVGNGAAGHVTIIAPILELPGGRIRASTQGAGNAGTVTVDAGRVSLTEGGQIFSNTSSTGQGGTVTVTASEALRISGQSSAGDASGLFSNSTGSGNAGRVATVTPVLEMVGGQIQAVSTDVGKGGAIEVQASRVMLSGAAQLDSSAQGTGAGGTVSVTATDTLSLAENATIDVRGSGGGTVVIRGSTLLVDQASILADTVGDVDGAGIGIDIAVADAIRLTQGGTISTASSGAGKAGDVRITAGSVQMAGVGTIIGAEAFDRGRAGDIVMHVGTLTLAAGALISSTTTGTGQGGDVVVTATQEITLAGATNTDNPRDLAGLFAGTFGRGNAGRVAITTPTLTLEGFASISTSTFNEGNAGSVEVTADRVGILEGGASSAIPKARDKVGRLPSRRANPSLSTMGGGFLLVPLIVAMLAV